MTFRPISHLLEGREGRLRAMRFWSKVAMGAPEDCWNWQASLNGKGYGRFKLASYTTATAPRVALILSSQSEPEGLCALHSCDNPACCNPHHLRWGTVRDNSDDKVSRGRHRNGALPGFSNPRCKLSRDQLAEIVQGLLDNKSNTEIAKGLPVRAVTAKPVPFTRARSVKPMRPNNPAHNNRIERP